MGEGRDGVATGSDQPNATTVWIPPRATHDENEEGGRDERAGGGEEEVEQRGAEVLIVVFVFVVVVDVVDLVKEVVSRARRCGR